MAFGLAISGVSMGCARQGWHFAGFCRGLAALALVAATAMAQPEPAQGQTADHAGGARDAGAVHGQSEAGFAGIGERRALTGPDPADPADDGTIGLIEAPDQPATARSTSMADGVAAATDTVGAMAERGNAQARGRVIGPIGHPLVVVELFTSQGCSSCPPADEMLNDLAERDDILALSWHIDYWDYLGWADEFAQPAFTARQQAYAHSWGERAIYTPQMVVGGTDTLIMVRPAELMALIEAQMARPAPVLVTAEAQQDGYRIELTPRAPINDRVSLLLVRYLPERKVLIRAGENRGVEVSYRNVVVGVERVGEWDGRAPLRMTVTAKGPSSDAFPADTRHAILAQQVGSEGAGHATGPILAAIRLD